METVDRSTSSRELEARKAANRMRRQGVVGWVLYHPDTGLVLHLYRTLQTARNAVPALSARHRAPFEVFGVHASGDVFRQIEGRLTERARDVDGGQLRAPLEARRIHGPFVRRCVSA